MTNVLQWGYFEVGIYTGPGRAEVLKDFKMGRLDVVVTSFETARADIALLDDLAWSCIIIDEAHRLKNSRSKSSLAYSQFECAVRFGLSATGAPISPSLEFVVHPYLRSHSEQIFRDVGDLGMVVPWLRRVSEAVD